VFGLAGEVTGGEFSQAGAAPLSLSPRQWASCVSAQRGREPTMSHVGLPGRAVKRGWLSSVWEFCFLLFNLNDLYSNLENSYILF
jgi:hypothetical protein